MKKVSCRDKKHETSINKERGIRLGTYYLSSK